VGVRELVARVANGPTARTLRRHATESGAGARSAQVDQTEFDRLTRSQGALRHVAMLVARGVSPTEAFKTVAAELGSLLGADCAMINRYENDQTATVVACWSDPRAPNVITPFAGRWPLGHDTAAAMVLRTGGPIRKNSETFVGDIGDWARAHRIKHLVSGPVWVEGYLWGEVAVLFRHAAPPPPDTEERMGDFVELVACTIAQAKSRADLIDSRARVIAASDAARRRIERDLHDGVQQHLVSLKFDLHAAESALPPGQEDLRQRLTNTGENLSCVISELQEICRGLHPAILTKSGLTSALEALARRAPLPVELHADLPASVPEQVQVAVYYTVSEALTNAVKHAHASSVRVELGHQDHEVRLSVRDNGLGGAVVGQGSGLLGLKDRVEAVQGTLRLRSPAGEGTSLQVTIPV